MEGTFLRDESRAPPTIVDRRRSDRGLPSPPEAQLKIPWRIWQVGSDNLADMSDTDRELLARYVREDAEDAFADLVHRHLGLVYSAALRQVRSPQLAEEVAQSVFLDLARGAARLRPDTILSAWLYQVTRRTAIDVVRRETSRQLREQIATEMNAMNAAAEWTHIAPLLEEAMHTLDPNDRAAVLLRYFENKSLQEVGNALGTSDNAAQKRLARAMERLRKFFARRGVVVGASGLMLALSTQAIQASPVGLAMTISTAAVQGAYMSAAPALVTQTIIMTTLQKALLVTGLALGVAVGVRELVLAAYSEKSTRPAELAKTGMTAPPDGMTTTASGLKYQVLRRGTGTVSPGPTARVRVHYHGTLPDGTVFDSSMDRGTPMVFPVDSVIPGWTEGIQLMKVGDLFQFEIPPHLGYGAAKLQQSKIPPNSTLLFEVELLEIQ
jgi:RNA polymerase sigma factor (sigma-70 family)